MRKKFTYIKLSCSALLLLSTACSIGQSAPNGKATTTETQARKAFRATKRASMMNRYGERRTNSTDLAKRFAKRKALNAKKHTAARPRRPKYKQSQISKSLVQKNASLPLKGGFLDNKAPKKISEVEKGRKKLAALLLKEDSGRARLARPNKEDIAPTPKKAVSDIFTTKNFKRGLAKISSTIGIEKNSEKVEKKEEIKKTEEKEEIVANEEETNSLISEASELTEDLASKTSELSEEFTSTAKSFLDSAKETVITTATSVKESAAKLLAPTDFRAPEKTEPESKEAATEITEISEAEDAPEAEVAQEEIEAPVVTAKQTTSSKAPIVEPIISEKSELKEETAPLEEKLETSTQETPVISELDDSASEEKIEIEGIDEPIEITNERFKEDLSEVKTGFLARFGLGNYSLAQESIFMFAFLIFFFLVAWLRVEYEQNFSSKLNRK